MTQRALQQFWQKVRQSEGREEDVSGYVSGYENFIFKISMIYTSSVFVVMEILNEL